MVLFHPESQPRGRRRGGQPPCPGWSSSQTLLEYLQRDERGGCFPPPTPRAGANLLCQSSGARVGVGWVSSPALLRSSPDQAVGGPIAQAPVPFPPLQEKAGGRAWTAREAPPPPPIRGGACRRRAPRRAASSARRATGRPGWAERAAGLRRPGPLPGGSRRRRAGHAWPGRGRPWEASD